MKASNMDTDLEIPYKKEPLRCTVGFPSDFSEQMSVDKELEWSHSHSDKHKLLNMSLSEENLVVGEEEFKNDVEVVGNNIVSSDSNTSVEIDLLHDRADKLR